MKQKAIFLKHKSIDQLTQIIEKKLVELKIM